MRVCVFGQMNNGKSTLAKYLLTHLNDNIRMRMNELKITNVFQIASFAKAVKDSVVSKYDIHPVDIETWKNRYEIFPGWAKTMREALQLEGENSRLIDPKVWIKKVMTIPYPIIIDDGRYENEAQAVYDSGGYNILIYRPDHINGSTYESYIGDLIKSINNGYSGDNRSNSIRYYHHIICNDANLVKLNNQAFNIATKILERMVRDAN